MSLSNFDLKSSAKRSIKRRIVLSIGTLVLLSLVVITMMASVLTYQLMKQQTEEYFTNQAQAVYDRIDQRLNFLIENTSLLTQNELMINALTDAEGRERYLTPLVKNFIDGKDVLSFVLLDYEGTPIFQTRSDVPGYNESSQLRMALAMHKTSYYIENKRFFVVAPIEYYSTTQGALLVEFDLGTIAQRNLSATAKGHFRLRFGDSVLFSQQISTRSQVLYLSQPIHDQARVLSQLGLEVEIGIEEAVFYQPIFSALAKVWLIGVLLMLTALFAGYWVAESIVEPVLELLRRVKASSDDGEVLCSPLGTHDELEDLARAFDERTLNLQHQAEYDGLTQLPNRALFIDRLNQSIELSKRLHSQLAVMFLDLDRFKEVNDSFGHDIGDQLLVSVSKMIQQNIHSVDSVARFGGDEFVILLNQVESVNDVTETAEKLLAIFKQPFQVGELEFYITCSMGIVLAAKGEVDVSSLLKYADSAMFRAKHNGRNTFAFYDESMTQKAYERVGLERELRAAITGNELVVYYQPQVDMTGSKLIGMEALIRWNHPQKGLVPPGLFIPFAEETGLIVELDRWMMREAFAQMQRWVDQGLDTGVLSVNLSIMQLNHMDFIDYVTELLTQTGLPPERVMFEVTETQVMRHPEHAIVALNHLKSLGVGIAIDDFGTGHSSLSYLKRLPVDKLKIDQSFVRDIPQDKDDVELVKAIIHIAQILHINVLAEGVETLEQSNQLIENGCVEAQGYLYSKPISAQQLAERWL